MTNRKTVTSGMFELTVDLCFINGCHHGCNQTIFEFIFNIILMHKCVEN